MLRILFIDDDESALNRAQESLRSYRNQWEMKFCVGAEAALDALGESAYDVVLADLKMPGVSGAELLSCVRDLYPDAVRILVCNASDDSTMMKSIGPAHQYLVKPLDPSTVPNAICRAATLGQRLSKPGLKALVSQIDTLPSLPGIYLQLLEELRRVDTSVARVAELISHDIGMTAKVLQLVNSSFFGLSVHVQDVTHAAALLGLNALRPLVLSAGVFRQLEESKVPSALVEDVLQHSLLVGRLAKQIAEAEGLDREAADNSMLAGIVHDVGKLVLADYFGQNYSTVCMAAERTGLPLLEAELDQFEASHADVGGFLLGLWGLPQTLIEAVAFHHDPSSHATTEFSPLSAVHVANALIHEVDAYEDVELDEEEGSPAVSPAKRLDEDHLVATGRAGRLEAWRHIAMDALQRTL